MSYLLDKINEQHVHKFNPIVANGVSVHQMAKALEYIDASIKLAAQSFPKGLEYKGYKKCTVEQEVAFLTTRKNTQHSLELAPSDVFLVHYFFSFNGVDLPPKPVFVPYVNKAGMITLWGKRFTIFPVLADETISVSKEDIFVPFLSTKVTFKRMQYWFKLDGQQRTEYLVFSRIYHHDPNSQARRATRANLSVNCKHTMAHYLFGKYGVAETFRRFCNVEIFITDSEVDRSVFPEETYVVCTSSQIRPRSVKNKNYRPTEIKIVFERDKINNGTLGLLSGLFYVLDHYPDRFTLDTLDGTTDEIRLWRIILGHAIFRNNDSEGEFFNRVNEHYITLDNYMDNNTREGLEAQSFPVNDIYDLMMILIQDFTNILMTTDQASMFGKMLAVNRYVLADIIKAISIFNYKVSGIRNKVLDYSDINKYLSKFLKPEITWKNL